MSSLDRAAAQSNHCREIAAQLHQNGIDHNDDPTWNAAAQTNARLSDAAQADGYDFQDIGDAARRMR